MNRLASTGERTPPTQLAIRVYFALRVVLRVLLGPVAGVAADGDGVANGDLVGADEDVFDEQPQDPLALGHASGGSLVAQPGQEVLEVVGELEVDLTVGELGVQGVELVAQAGLAGPQLGHAGAQLVQGDQLLLVGADEPLDRLAGLGQGGVEPFALRGGRVGGAVLGEPLGDLGSDQGGVGQQPGDVVPDEAVEVVGAARQKEQETIGSQTAALRAHAGRLGLDVPEQWVFEDDGHSGASLVRPALERLRDLVCQVPVDVLLVYSPDRLARKYAYQALLIEEFARAGTAVVFVKGPRSDSPEDALLVQFQGMIAEYERAQILERTRRGKTHRAKAGTVNVLSGAPFGYRYVRKSDHAEARYEIVPHEAAIVAELFGRYADGGVAIGELTRWLTALGVATRTGKPRWDRSVLWSMLRNPAYAGRACFGKTMRTEATAGVCGVAQHRP